MKDYVAIANEYIEDVLSGKIIACQWTRLACQRQRDDLAAPTGRITSTPTLRPTPAHSLSCSRT